MRRPVRPNDAQGWIPADDASVAPTPWRIIITRSAQTIAVVRDDALVRSFSVVVGKPARRPRPSSHGCVRMDNDAIDCIARHVQVGTPVLVVR